jgi:hypothetical protein
MAFEIGLPVSRGAAREAAGKRLSGRVQLLLGGTLLFAAFVGLFALIQFATPGLAGNDGYYHIKMAQLIRQHEITPPFVWLPMSILSPEAYYDHHFLYHLYLALFVPRSSLAATPDTLILRAKIASVLMPALAFMAIWWLLRKRGVRWAWLWALGLFAASDAFLYRMSMPRAQSASLLFLVIGAHWLLERRYRLLLLLGFLYVWLYNAFPLLLIVALVYAVAVLIVERRLEWRPVVAVAVGIGLGILINPYFPQNVNFIVSHILPKIGETGSQVGNEWSAYQTWTLVENSGGALLLFLAGVFALGWREKRFDVATLFAFGLVVVFGVMAFKSRRFIEYFPAFALIFAALSVSPLIKELELRWPRWVVAAGLVLLLSFPLARNVLRGREALARSGPADQYADAAAWLAENAPPGSLVFQTDWDDFPRLFFFNTSQVYTIGLDVTYMQLYSADLYDEWVDITRGEVEQPGSVIASRFDASYVFSDLKHGDFIDEAHADPVLSEVYRDDDAVIFEVNP